jgi:hypothetical protein
MKAKPTDQSKLLFNVTIENSSFKTWAVDEDKAISNACFRYAEENDTDVKLVKWKLKNGKLVVIIEEI